MSGIELGKEREQLWPEKKEEPQMLGFCYNAVRSNAQQAGSINYMKAGLLKQPGKLD